MQTKSAAANSAGILPVVERRQDNRTLSKEMFADLAAAVDITLIVASGLLIKYFYVHLYFEGKGIGQEAYLAVIGIVAAALFASLRRRCHYVFDNDWNGGREALRLAVSVMFSFGLALFVIFLLKKSSAFSRVWLVSSCASTYVILFGCKVLWRRLYQRLSARGCFRARVLLFGTGNALRHARLGLLSAQSHAELAGVIDFRSAVKGDVRKENRLASALELAVARGQTGQIDEILIALPAAENELLEAIIRPLRSLSVDLKIALDFGGRHFKLHEVSQIGPTSTVSVQKRPISEWNFYLKAFEDYILATLSLMIFLPAMAVIALAIKLDSKGPVLFRQRRHGANHKVFEVLKFRTMTVLEDSDTIVQAIKNDKRVTRVGRILRKTSLDELPQLLNVLAGEMSLVGPRPHALAHNNYYSKMLENYASRHRVKPGITGWAQINGLRGEITDPELMEQRVRRDLEYIDNWSIGFDVYILLLTPIFGFLSRRAY
ncbi:MAG: undecaprenyl-phosphate glucose phosphotransferase [Rhodomicrobium sp.]